MLGLILNESEIVNDILCYDKLSEKHFTCINLLIKYYYINNVTDKLDIQERTIKDMERCDIEFKRARWEEIIKKAINKFFKDRKKFGNEVEMVDIENVKITKSELDKITELKDKKFQKVAFILLVYAKITNIINKRSGGWINQSFNNIFKEAKVSVRGNNKQMMLHELSKMEYLTVCKNNNKTSLKVNYIDDDSEVIIELKDFNGVIHEYLKYIGEKWKRCKECNEWILQKSNRKAYCKKCLLKKQKEWEKTSKNSKKQVLEKSL